MEKEDITGAGDLFFEASEGREFAEVLQEVQEHIASRYSALLTDGVTDDVKRQIKRYITKYIQDSRISVSGMTNQELVDNLYTEMAEFYLLTKYLFGEGVDDEKYVDFKVTWVQYASVKVIKRDAKADAKLAGAVFGLYSDANCTNLITKLPATDANGEASVQIIKTQNTVYLKEITAPTGYRINATAYNVKLEVSL